MSHLLRRPRAYLLVQTQVLSRPFHSLPVLNAPAQSPTRIRAEQRQQKLAQAQAPPQAPPHPHPHPHPITPSAPTDLLPLPLLASAHKSKVLPFGPGHAQTLINSYPISQQPSAVAASSYITDTITSHDLSLLAHILLRSRTDEIPARLTYARHMLATASHAGDGDASVTLHALLKRAVAAGSGSGGGGFARSELAACWGRIKSQAEAGHAGCLMLVGDDHVVGDKAEECWRRAGEAGEARGWLKLGLELKANGKLEEARTAWRRGAEEEEEGERGKMKMKMKTKMKNGEECLLQLARTMEKGDAEYERLLLKAASGGVMEASLDLGRFYEGKAGEKQEEEEEEAEEEEVGLKWASEWYLVAAEDGVAEAMDGLHRVLRRMGKEEEAAKWQELADEKRGVLGLDFGKIIEEKEKSKKKKTKTKTKTKR